MKFVGDKRRGTITIKIRFAIFLARFPGTMSSRHVDERPPTNLRGRNYLVEINVPRDTYGDSGNAIYIARNDLFVHLFIGD